MAKLGKEFDYYIHAVIDWAMKYYNYPVRQPINEYIIGIQDPTCLN